jgi:membrane-bound lytic murein transglycosylase B
MITSAAMRSVVHCAFALALSTSVVAAAPGGYGQRDDVRAFAAEMADEHGFDRAEVQRWLAAAKYQPQIVTLMSKPLLEPPKWFEYAPPFLAPERVAAGAAYWRAHADDLARAEAAHGVPPEIIVAILGIETYWGRYTGSHRVIDALATLAFDYPRRAGFFRGELKEYLLLARDQGFSPLTQKGSFAGAMGIPQFMPGSYRRYAIDFDGDGHADLWKNDPDITLHLSPNRLVLDGLPPRFVPRASSRGTLLLLPIFSFFHPPLILLNDAFLLYSHVYLSYSTREKCFPCYNICSYPSALIP